jgi:hypothetical protein
VNIGAVAIGRNGDGGTPGYVPIAIRTRHYHTLAVASTSPPVMRHVESVERAPGDGPHQRAGLSRRVSTEFGKSPQSRWTRAIASRRPDAHCECPMSPPSDPSISHVSRMYLAHAPSPRPDPASPQRGGQICESDTGRPHRPLEMRRPSRLIAREGPLPRALARPRQALCQALCRALCRVPRGIGVSLDTSPGAGHHRLLARAVS